MKKNLMIGLAALLAAPMALAGAPPKGEITGYVSMTEVDDGSASDDGLGFGVRGWGMLNPQFFGHGEFQTVTLDDSDLDITVMRIGGGMVGELTPNAMWMAKGEYLDFGSDLDQAGFGVHGGVLFQASPMIGLSGSLGYLTTDDTDGLEFNVGIRISHTKELATVVDYRTYMGSVDPSGDLDVTDLRAGISYRFY